MNNKKITCHDVMGKKYLFESNKLKFRPSVYGILIERGKILLSKQWDGYDFPGGGIELGEDLERALVREFKEETGLIVKPIKLVDIKSSFFVGRIRKGPWHSILIYFLVAKVGGSISLKNITTEERRYIDMAEWVSLKNLKKVKFYNAVDSSAIIKEAVKFK